MIIATLMTVFSLMNLSTSQLTYSHPDYIEQPQSSYAILPETRNDPETPPANLQLPKVEAPRPFFIPEPSDSLKPPAANSPVMDFKDFKDVPSEDLVAPTEDKWNPQNEPIYFYPVEKLTANLPTSTYPKKYNKNLDKVKPNSLKTKEVLANLESVIKQKNLDKIINSLEKQENKKRLEEERAEQVKDADVAASGVFGLAADNLIHANAITHKGERTEFQMHGHAGPHSYKWGYDTGKGHNRQFRFEERDKDGYVKGHYGYYDKTGKLRVVHYDAHPHDGFHAHGNFGH